MVEDGDQALGSIVVDYYFNIFAICIRVRNGRVAITQGLEQLAGGFAGGFHHIFHRLAAIDLTSNLLEDLRQRYCAALPDGVDFSGFPSCHTMTMIDILIRRDWNPHPVWQNDDRPSNHEHTSFTQCIVGVAMAEHQQEQKIPEWILGFAFDSLSLDPLPPTPVVAGCLKVTAINLGCDISALDEGYVCLCPICIHLLTRIRVQLGAVLNLIILKLKTMVKPDQILPISKCEAICTIIPYAMFLAEDNQPELANAVMNIVQASKNYYFMSSISSYITTLFGKPMNPFRDWLITLISPHISWKDGVHGAKMVRQWFKAVLRVPDTVEVVWSVIATLMEITSIDSLRQCIPVEIWGWMKKWKSLPPVYWGQFCRATPDVLQYVQELGDFEIVMSYLLVWSVWYSFHVDDLNEVEILIRREFDKIGMQEHQKDFFNWLDYVLNKMVMELEDTILYDEWRKRCEKLKIVMLDMGQKTKNTSTCKLLKLLIFNKYTD